MIETKLLYEAAIRKIPEDKLPDIEQRLNTEFEKEPLARMMKQSGCETRQQLDVKLRTFGSALDKERRNFRMQVIARQWLQGQIKVREDISRDEMLRYYREHAADYERPAQAKWQEVVLRLDRFSSRDEAVRALAEIGNRLIAGAPMAEEAKRHSHGREAAEGGLHDWTTQGSLVSVETDRALFSLPVGRLSPIIEDDRNVRIVTVIERNDAGRVPFADTQDAIRTKIREDRFEQARTDFLAKLRQDAYVWTVFDGQLPAPNLEDTSTARKP